ncbi:3'-5' exonuclease [Meiothermus sp. QL-1]|uniref:3'-5' exonuclease n=1 Tax=Meiothermus sp. QL-1 TaxID=2058095 RepID=UPI000E0A84B9|nr:3'-5' exonuclease [Meiothermus sp. QL-1]RDI94643.1 3'-5' exonuclease [Meiothermus sp. QL-1]
MLANRLWFPWHPYPHGKTPSWWEATYWALDLETSGLEPSDQILSVGMVPIREGVIEFGAHFYSLVRPQRPEELSLEGIRAHHILPAELESAPPLAVVMEKVLHRVGQGVLLLHFAPLDLGFLKQACRSLGLGWPRPRVVDTAVLLSRLNHRRQRLEPYAQPLPSALGAARRSLGLPPHLEHHALWDALATAELFLLLRERLGARTLRELL